MPVNVNMQHSKLESETKSTCFIPIKTYNSTINLFASRCRVKKTNPTTAKISKYHILENENTGRDICHKILNTDIGLDKCYSNINCNEVIPVLSRILELFKKGHNRFNYLNELKCVLRDCKKQIKQKYKNQIHKNALLSFFHFLIYKNVPLELFGTVKNLKIIKKMISGLLKTVPRKRLIIKAFRRTVRKTNATGASLDISPLLEKLDISKITWLRSIDSNTKRWIIILKLLHWFFAQYIVKILHKYIVLISVKKQWVYIAKDDWCKMQKEFVKEKKDTCLVPYTPVKLHDQTTQSNWNLPIGRYKFIPSSSGLRALIIAKYTVQKKFDDVDIVLRFLQQLYVTYINENGIPIVGNCIQAINAFRQSKTELFYVQCDIQDAFGSIKQDKLYDIVKTCYKELPLYLPLRSYTLPTKNQNYTLSTKNQENNKKNGKTGRQVNNNMHRGNRSASQKSSTQTAQFLTLKKSIHKDAVMNKEKPILVKKTKLMSKIKKLIFEQKIKLDDQIYLIKQGVPQGARISPILSEMYYQHMVKTILSEYAQNGCLCIYVDDILYITESEHYATRFRKIVENGIPEYNVKFNPNKIQSNVGVPYKPTKIKYVGYKIKL